MTVNAVQTRAAPYNEYELDCGDDVVWKISDFYNQNQDDGNGAFRIREVRDMGTVFYGYGGNGYLIAVKRGAGVADWIGGGHGNAGTAANFTITQTPDTWQATYDLTGYWGGDAVLSQTYTLTFTCGKWVEHVVNESLVSDLDITIEYRGVLRGPGACYAGGGYNKINEKAGIGCASVTTGYTLDAATQLESWGDFRFRVTNDIYSQDVLLNDRSGNTVVAYLRGLPRSVSLGETWESTTTYEVPPLATTTWDTIRNAMIVQLETATTPTSLAGDLFRSHQDERDFIDTVEAAPAASFRTFDISDIELDDAGAALNDSRKVEGTFTIMVGYPANFRYGPLRTRDRERVMAEDFFKFDDSIGLKGYTNVANVAVLEPEKAILDVEGAHILEMTYRAVYCRAA